MKKAHVFIFLLALLAIASSCWRLLGARTGLVIERTLIDEIPTTTFRPTAPPNGQVALIAHGFAGSQQLMQPMALTLAHSGYTAVTFDFAGHGRNARPMRGGVKDMEESTRTLTAEIDQMTAFARGLSGGKPIALVGHSMAADLITQYAMDRTDIGAVAALSVFGAGITREQPRNLIVITGAWEPAMLTDAAARIAGLAADGPARERVTYGDFAQGPARRYVLPSCCLPRCRRLPWRPHRLARRLQGRTLPTTPRPASRRPMSIAPRRAGSLMPAVSLRPGWASSRWSTAT